MDPMNPQIELVLTEAYRALDRQAARLDDLRGRAGTLVTVASVSAAFLGVETLTGEAGSLTVLTILGGTMFIVLVVVGVFALRPVSGWRFANEPKKLIECTLDMDERTDVVGRWLIEWAAEHHEENEKRLGVIVAMVRAMTLLLLAEIILLLLDLAWKS